MEEEHLPRARNYCFTVWAEEGEPLLLLDPDLWPDCSYFVYQRELCPSTNREHFQCYMELSKQVVGKVVKTWPGLEHSWFKARKGTQRQAREYAMKEDTRIEGPWEYGVTKHQGQRTDLLEIQSAIKQGASIKRLHEDYFPEMLRFGKAVREYKRVVTAPRNFKPFVLLLVGPAGTGKSRTALTLAKALGSVYVVPDKHTGFWCDDYDGEEVFFLDEMDGDRIRPKAFNSLCDRYECVLPAHGNAGNQLVARYIILCSNYLPKYWWRRRSEEQLRQTTRRIDQIWGMFRHIPKRIPNLCPYCVEGLCAFHHP